MDSYIKADVEALRRAAESEDSDYERESYAHNLFEIICNEIKLFQDSLDNEHEIALLMTNFGKSIILYAHTITFLDPCFICYCGTADGKESRLIQHISQTNFLMQVKDVETSKAPRRIGFGDLQG